MPGVKFVPVTIGGQVYELAYNFNGLAEAEKITGANLLQGMGMVINGGISASELRGVLFAALRKAQPELTLQDAGNLIEVAIDEGGIGDIREALLTAYRVSFEKTDPPKAGPAAGTENSPS